MRLPDDQNKYTSQWKYVEVARYVPGLDRVIRDMVKEHPDDEKKTLPLFLPVDEVEAYAKRYGNVGIYTSVFQYNEPSLSGSIRLGSLYFDLDSSDLEQSRLDAIKLYEYFKGFVPLDAIRVYFTGSKGFHIELEALTLGITPGNHLAELFRYIAGKVRDELELTTIDFAVYDPRRMWRRAGSIHQSTKLYKNPLTEEILYGDIDGIKEFCSRPVALDVPEQVFSLKANEWFRSFIYKREEEKQGQKYTQEYLLERFRKQGTGVLRTVEDERLFDPQRLFEGCPSILKLWEKAERDHHLEHEERLFLCSILTYSDDALFYLHEILKNCSDYNFEKSQAHIDDWIKRREFGIGGRPYTCERANSVGVGCGSCDLEKKKKWIKVGDSYIESDENSSPSPIRFAYRRINKE